MRPWDITEKKGGEGLPDTITFLLDIVDVWDGIGFKWNFQRRVGVED